MWVWDGRSYWDRIMIFTSLGMPSLPDLEFPKLPLLTIGCLTPVFNIFIQQTKLYLPKCPMWVVARSLIQCKFNAKCSIRKKSQYSIMFQTFSQDKVITLSWFCLHWERHLETQVYTPIPQGVFWHNLLFYLKLPQFQLSCFLTYPPELGYYNYPVFCMSVMWWSLLDCLSWAVTRAGS